METLDTMSKQASSITALDRRNIAAFCLAIEELRDENALYSLMQSEIDRRTAEGLLVPNLNTVWVDVAVTVASRYKTKIDPTTYAIVLQSLPSVGHMALNNPYLCRDNFVGSKVKKSPSGESYSTPSVCPAAGMIAKWTQVYNSVREQLRNENPEIGKIP